MSWVKVFSSVQPYRAELVKQLLEQHGLMAVLLNRQDSMYRLWGEAEVYVSLKDEPDARMLIRNHFSFTDDNTEQNPD